MTDAMTDATMTITTADGSTVTGPYDPAKLRDAVRGQLGKPPMKETAADTAEADRVYGIAAGELRQLIERVERLEEEKKEVAEQIKEVMAEAKGRGHDTKVMRKVIALRKRDADDIAEEEAVLDMYKAALGMA